MALGHNLDDMAQSILMNFQKGEVERSIRLAPHTENPIDGIAPRIVPLRWIPEQEIHAHAICQGLPIHHGDCPHAPGAMRQQSRGIVAQMESMTPGARHGLLHSLDEIPQNSPRDREKSYGRDSKMRRVRRGDKQGSLSGLHDEEMASRDGLGGKK
ncbi:MAG: hypothetical protein CM1200mP21_06940 [Candidatus Poseidoniales archaeon]|nr:MAG: hypothetical protein CM1200mP21_06940 [Candidatus Poseidoniales archaeon]